MLKILEYDNYLKPFEKDLSLRNDRLQDTINMILKDKKAKNNKAILEFSDAYNYFGFHKIRGGYVYREYAPHADELYLIGDFNNWNRTSHKLTNKLNGIYEIVLKEDISNSRVKVRVVSKNGDEDRIPLYTTCTKREPDYSMSGYIYNSTYKFKNKSFKPSKNLFIYEAHIGMAQDKEGVGSYDEFRENILPKIAEEGFTAIQLMGIMEHPYYASFGYQVSNFFAPSSFYGMPDDLKKLIDEAHSLGIAVLLDIVHAHACKNTMEGINRFDGSEDLFFKCEHPSWGTMIFDYSKTETLQFLLSNIKYYLKEFKFDGFRFDGVTSMLYTNCGLGENFDNYSKYFSLNTNIDAINYLQLATTVAKEVNKNCILIAEDMSAMPGMCLKIQDGGIGFDYRLALGQPDLWIKLIKEQKDEDWNMNHIYYELATRRPMEKNIGYAECHDQALVGDKTIIFRLIDKEMYWHMSRDDNDLTVSRGVSLYKNIYGITMTLGGEGYLNFMGNEFGHPEWIDFPRDGNGNSYKYCRRQWHLAEDDNLKYKYLLAFNKDLIKICKDNNVLDNKDHQILCNDQDQIIIYKKGNFLFVVSFNPTKSFTDYFVPFNHDVELIFSSDFKQYQGFDRLNLHEKHLLIKEDNKKGIMLYIPNRTFNIYKICQ